MPVLAPALVHRITSSVHGARGKETASGSSDSTEQSGSLLTVAFDRQSSGDFVNCLPE